MVTWSLSCPADPMGPNLSTSCMALPRFLQVRKDWFPFKIVANGQIFLASRAASSYSSQGDS